LFWPASTTTLQCVVANTARPVSEFASALTSFLAAQEPTRALIGSASSVLRWISLPNYSNPGAISIFVWQVAARFFRSFAAHLSKTADHNLTRSAGKRHCLQGRSVMLTIYGSKSRFCDGVSRRNFLKIGSLALGGLTFAELLRAEAQSGIR